MGDDGDVWCRASARVQEQCSEMPSAKRYEGIVTWFRGSFGWIQCSEIKNDIFLHKIDCVKKVSNSYERPKQGDTITFHLSTDEKGGPKAIDARIHVNDTNGTEAIDVREYLRTR